MACVKFCHVPPYFLYWMAHFSHTFRQISPDVEHSFWFELQDFGKLLVDTSKEEKDWVSSKDQKKDDKPQFQPPARIDAQPSDKAVEKDSKDLNPDSPVGAAAAKSSDEDWTVVESKSVQLLVKNSKPAIEEGAFRLLPCRDKMGRAVVNTRLRHRWSSNRCNWPLTD